MSLCETLLPKEVITEVAVPLAKAAAHEVHELYEHSRPSGLRNDCESLVKNFGTQLKAARKEDVPQEQLRQVMDAVVHDVDVIVDIGGDGPEFSNGPWTSLMLWFSKGRLQKRISHVEKLRHDSRMKAEVKTWEVLLDDGDAAEVGLVQDGDIDDDMRRRQNVFYARRRKGKGKAPNSQGSSNHPGGHASPSGRAPAAPRGGAHHPSGNAGQHFKAHNASR